jgi:hypothetical protein
MKINLLVFAAGMTSLSLASCNNNSNDLAEKQKEVVSGELSVIATGTSTYAGTDETQTVAFTGDDIESYNASTGELIFNDLSFEQVRSRTEEYTLSFYLGDSKLFESASIGYDTAWILSGKVIDDLVFILRSDMNERLYLMDGYPALDWIGSNHDSDEEAASRKKRAENVQKRAEEWELFINYLQDAGKLVEQISTPVEKPGNSLPPIDSISIIATIVPPTDDNDDAFVDNAMNLSEPIGVTWCNKSGLDPSAIYIFNEQAVMAGKVPCSAVISYIDWDKESLIAICDKRFNANSKLEAISFKQTGDNTYLLEAHIIPSLTDNGTLLIVYARVPKLKYNDIVHANLVSVVTEPH